MRGPGEAAQEASDRVQFLRRSIQILRACVARVTVLAINITANITHHRL
jgi:hypothetical protein